MGRAIIYMLENSWGVDVDDMDRPRPKTFFEAGKEYMVSKQLADEFYDKMIAVPLSKAKLPEMENKELPVKKKRKYTRRKKVIETKCMN